MTTRFALKLMTAAAVLGAAITMSTTAGAQGHFNPAYGTQPQTVQYYGGPPAHMAPRYAAPPAYGHQPPPRHWGWRHRHHPQWNGPYYGHGYGRGW